MVGMAWLKCCGRNGVVERARLGRCSIDSHQVNPAETSYSDGSQRSEVTNVLYVDRM